MSDMHGSYGILAPVYDELNIEDYNKWADFISECFKRYSGRKTESVLDLGCGTGAMTIPLAVRGYDMIGLDISPEMLCEADFNANKAGIRDKILFVEEDMCSFELYGTVDAVVCCLDGINHLNGREALRDCFACVSRFLAPGGLFVFDLNTPYKFSTKFNNREYVIEDDDALVVQRIYTHNKCTKADFIMTVFKENEDGTWSRSDAGETEYAYTLKMIDNRLAEAGMERADVLADFEFSDISAETERWYIIARKKNT